MGALSSTTQQGSPYENAVAERVNGILKQEFMLEATYSSLEEAKAAVDQAVWIYNNVRPHYSNHYLTPVQMHAQNRQAMRKYKTTLPLKHLLEEEAGAAGGQPVSNKEGRYTDGTGANIKAPTHSSGIAYG